MYEPFAVHFAEHARDSAYNAHYDRPAVLDLVGDVRGLDVLDAGCGPGYYTEQLVAGGARVTAFDASPTLVDIARERVGDTARVRVGDLAQPLDWIDDASFDVVVLALVLHHLDDRAPALAELRRVLRRGGRLVVSTTHPTSDWLRLAGSYFDVERVEETWNDGWAVAYWRAPLQLWIDELVEPGFLVERIVEPRPADSMRAAHPETHAALEQSPGFIALRLVAV
jgi:SAM-dependent methyltransferase